MATNKKMLAHLGGIKLHKGTKALSGVIQIFHILLWVVFAQVNTIAKTYKTGYLRSVHFIVCKLCLNLKKTTTLCLLDFSVAYCGPAIILLFSRDADGLPCIVITAFSYYKYL